MERKVTAAKKKQIAGKQRYCCAASVEGYICPLAKKPFDEAGYEIDHIVELCKGGSNEDGNLQALCIMCHRVKTSRLQMAPKPKAAKPKAVKPKAAEPSRMWNGIPIIDPHSRSSKEVKPKKSLVDKYFDSDSDFDSD
jgi:5-methylcytosine-specific restriction endonuclease McrA